MIYLPTVRSIEPSSGSLIRLPVELLCLITSYCDSYTDINAVTRCNKLLYQSLNILMYRRNMQDLSGSALTWAAACRRPDTARKVFESCQGVVLSPVRLRVALFLATQNWSRVIVKMLIDHGADVNARIGWYGHVLQAASWRGDASLVQSLLDVGADVNAQGGHYGNALQAASLAGHEGIVCQLMQAGATSVSLN
jgi:hypothetical protein